MSYEALARKYRPRTFEEVVGQEPIIRTLTNALREGRIHHAYVFSGVRGVGKTTVARIFAKALNCEKGPTPTPCLKCDACIEIAAGRDLDVIEMDAASRTGVDDVRDLIDTTRYAPARDRYKVFIIDEFHMLSKPAFNALLKTLEEPPPRVVFLMATTELHKVLPTVLSRTQQFDFRKVPIDEIVDQLAMIAKKEHVKAPRGCLEMLARAADGSVRDAESLLDQAIAYGGTELREPEVRTLLGLVPEETVEAFLAACAERDAGALLRILSGALAEGLDLRIFHAGLIEGLRRLLILSAMKHPSDILGLAKEDEERLAALAAQFSTESLLRVFSVLAGLEEPLKYSDQPRYLFEAAVIRLAAIAELAPIEDLITRLEAVEPSRGPGAPAGGPGSRADRAGEITPAAPRAGPPMDRPASAPSRPVPRTHRPAAPADPTRPVPPKRTRGTSEPETSLAGGGQGIDIEMKAGAWDEEAVDLGRTAAPGMAPSAAAGVASSAAGDAASSAAADAARGAAAAEIPAPDPRLDDEPRGEDKAVSDGDTEAPTTDPQDDLDDLAASDPDDGSFPSEPGAFDAAITPEDRVTRLLAALQVRNERLSILLARTARVFIEEDRVILLFEDSQAFARKSLEQPQNLAVLHEAVLEAEGRKLDVEIRRAAGDAVSSAPSAAGTHPPAGGAVRTGGPAAATTAGAATSSVATGGPATAGAATAATVGAATGGATTAATGGTAAAGATTAATVGSTTAARVGATTAATGGAAAAPRAPADEADRVEEDSSTSVREEPAVARRTTNSRSQDVAARAPDAVSRRPASEEGAGQAGGARYQRLLSQALEDPVVRNLLDRFGGRIVEIKEAP